MQKHDEWIEKCLQKKIMLSRVSKQTSRREMLFATNLIMEMKCFHGILCEAEEHGMHEE